MAKDIEIKVKLDTAGAQAQLQDAVNDLEQNPIEIPINIPVEGSIAQLKALKRELKNTAAGSEEFKKLFNQIDDLEEQIGAANKASSDWIDTLAGAGGSLGALGQGLNKGKEAFSSFNNILKTSIIGIIVTAVTLLYQAFNKNKEAQDKLKPVLVAFDKILGGIFRAAEPLLDLFVEMAGKVLPVVASAIGNVAAFVGGLVKGFGALGTAIKELFSGNFSKAIDAAKGSTKAFSDGFNETKSKFVNGTKEMTDAEKEEAEKRKELAEKAAEKRKALLEKQAADVKRIREKELADAKKQAEELAKLQLESDKNTEKLRTDNISAIDKATEIIREKQVGAQQAEIDKIKDKYFQQIEIATQFGQDTTALTEAQRIEIQAVNDKYDKIAKDATDKKAEDDKKAKADEKKRQEDVTKAKIDIQNQELDAVAGLVDIAKGLGEKNKDIQKAAIIAEGAIGIARIIVNTNVGATTEVATKGIFGLGTSAILYTNMAIKIASVVAATAKGLSAIGKGGSAGSSAAGGGAGGGGGTATQSTTPIVNLFGTGNPNANSNIPNATPSINNNLTVKAVVSETEITKTQQFVNKVEDSAKI